MRDDHDRGARGLAAHHLGGGGGEGHHAVGALAREGPFPLRVDAVGDIDEGHAAPPAQQAAEPGAHQAALHHHDVEPAAPEVGQGRQRRRGPLEAQRIEKEAVERLAAEARGAVEGADQRLVPRQGPNAGVRHRRRAAAEEVHLEAGQRPQALAQLDHEGLGAAPHHSHSGHHEGDAHHGSAGGSVAAAAGSPGNGAASPARLAATAAGAGSGAAAKKSRKGPRKRAT